MTAWRAARLVYPYLTPVLARQTILPRRARRIRRHESPAERAPLRKARGWLILNHMVQYSRKLDAGFAALPDPTRRGILARLGRGNATITDLAHAFAITLTGIKKHVQVLESAGLVATEKVGRARVCSLGPRTLDQEAAYIASYRRMLEDRLNRLEDFLERTK